MTSTLAGAVAVFDSCDDAAKAAVEDKLMDVKTMLADLEVAVRAAAKESAAREAALAAGFFCFRRPLTID